MGIGKRILSVLIGILFIISVSVLGGSLLAKQVLVKAISQAGIDTAISHRMMDAVFGYAGADDTQWIAKIQNKIEKNEEVQKITEKVMDEMVNDLSKGTGYKDVDISKELNQLLEDSMKEIKDSNPELTEDMLKLMKQQLKDEMDDVQDVLNSYASNLYGNMKDNQYDTGESCQIIYDAGINDLPGRIGSSSSALCNPDGIAWVSKTQRIIFTRSGKFDLWRNFCRTYRSYGKPDYGLLIGQDAGAYGRYRVKVIFLDGLYICRGGCDIPACWIYNKVERPKKDRCK